MICGWILDTSSIPKISFRQGGALAAVVVSLMMPAAGLAQVPDPLAEAREFYNKDQFEQAIARAEVARRNPDLANAAAVVLARAHLEQFRLTREAASLATARDLLRAANPAILTPRDRVEYFVGLGEALYLEDPPRYGAAAEFFAEALARASVVDAEARDLVFAWWAGSLDRLAQFGPEAGRRAIYLRLLAGAEAERAASPTSAAVWYWLAIGARGTGDLERAIGLATTGWIRAPEFGRRGSTLRTDLDRLMSDVVLPERASELAPDADALSELVLLRERWEAVKRDWR